MPATVTESLLGFARLLRDAGLAAGTDRVQALLAATETLGAADPAGVYWAGRLCLCSDPADLPVYDAAFAAWFGGQRPPPPPAAPARLVRGGALLTGQHRPTVAEADAHPAQLVRASDTELLRQR